MQIARVELLVSKPACDSKLIRSTYAAKAEAISTPEANSIHDVLVRNHRGSFRFCSYIVFQPTPGRLPFSLVQSALTQHGSIAGQANCLF
jgi:hypothetical protein